MLLLEESWGVLLSHLNLLYPRIAYQRLNVVAVNLKDAMQGGGLFLLFK